MTLIRCFLFARLLKYFTLFGLGQPTEFTIFPRGKNLKKLIYFGLKIINNI